MSKVAGTRNQLLQIANKHLIVLEILWFRVGGTSPEPEPAWDQVLEMQETSILSRLGCRPGRFFNSRQKSSGGAGLRLTVISKRKTG
jgi:hypothetical protein